MAENNTDPKGQSETTPPSVNGGQVNKDAAPLPKNLEGKTPDEILKMYSEAERKIGEMSAEVKAARDKEAKYQPILDTIWENQEIFNALDQALQNKSKPKEDKPQGQSTAQDETRAATEGLIISRFEDRYGINKMTDNERVELKQKIGQEVFDISGVSLSQVPLARLENILEKAYILANKDKLREAGKLEGIAEANANNAGAFGALPSSESKTETVTLSPKEREAAIKLGIGVEKYLEQKKKVSEYAR